MIDTFVPTFSHLHGDVIGEQAQQR